MTDRDPADPTALAVAAQIWLRTPEDRAARDESDVALEQVLLTQGVLCPDDIVREFRPNGDDTILVILTDATRFVIDAAFGDIRG